MNTIETRAILLLLVVTASQLRSHEKNIPDTLREEFTMTKEYEKACDWIKKEIAKIEIMSEKLPAGELKDGAPTIAARMRALVDEYKAHGFRELAVRQDDYRNALKMLLYEIAALEKGLTGNSNWNAAEKKAALRLYLYIIKIVDLQADIILNMIHTDTYMTPVVRVKKSSKEEQLSDYDIKINECLALIESICKANNMPVPRLFLGYSKRAKAFTLPSFINDKTQSIIFLDRSLFMQESSKEIQSIIAHELGHIYYGDGQKTSLSDKIFQEIKPENDALLKKYRYFKEHRADLFAAQYGFSKDLKNELESEHTPEEIACSGKTHPSTVSRATYLDTITSTHDLSILYDPIYYPRQSWVDYFLGKKNETIALKPIKNRSTSGKIVNISAQPIQIPKRAPAARSLLTGLTLLKKVK